MQPATQPLPHWHPFTRILFRIWGTYFLLYFVTGRITLLWAPLVTLLGSALQIEDYISAKQSGSGDGLFYYLQLLAILLVSVITGIIWSIIDRKRKSYNNALYYTWGIIRYIVGTYMLIYGLGKLSLSQFPAPFLHRLVQPYGTSSPMGLAWTFMGASQGFNYFTGGAEALGGLLLFFRPTAKVGALLSATVLSVIVAMNFCYDIPVKILSSHLLLGSLFILAPHIKRLALFLFSQKAIPASSFHIPHLNDTGLRIAKTAVKTIVLLIIAVFLAKWLKPGKLHEMQKDVPLYGLYHVENVIVNHDTLCMQATDTERWRYLILEFKERAIATHYNDSMSGYKFRVDTLRKGITMTDSKKFNKYFHYTQEGDYLIFERRLDDDTTHIVMRRKDEKDFLLTNRGFHWVNEYPYNR